MGGAIIGNTWLERRGERRNLRWGRRERRQRIGQWGEAMEEKSEPRLWGVMRKRHEKQDVMYMWLGGLYLIHKAFVLKKEIAGGIEGEWMANLFWDFCFPTNHEPGTVEWGSASDLTEGEFEAVLEAFADLEAAMRVPYEPDGAEPLPDLMNYVHIAACRAFLLKKRQGYSDDVRWLLAEADRAIMRFERFGKYTYFDYQPSDEYSRSFAAVMGLVQIEMARLRSIDCRFPEALGAFAAGLSYVYSSIRAALGGEDIDTAGDTLRCKRYVPDIDVKAQELADVFENLRHSAGVIDWSGVAIECEVIGEAWEGCLRDPFDTVKDSEQREWDWKAFWDSAQGWAKAKLEPSEFLEQMKRTEDEQAKQRLVTYFFEGGIWGALPERARQSLIEADKAWFSTRVGRAERMANELRIATEEVLWLLLWEPLCKWEDNPQLPLNLKLLDFHKIRQEQSESGNAPNLTTYLKVLKTEAFHEFLAKESSYTKESSFFREELPKHLARLRDARNEGEHEIGGVRQAAEVRSLFREWLGVGSRGILPRLAGMLAERAKGRQRRADAL